MRNELFWGEKGVGAFVNDRRLRVSGRRKLAEAVIATGIPVQNRTPHDVFLRQLGAVMAVASGVLRQGAAALDMAYVAAGRYDGFWEMGLKAWDIGAGILLVREAGGYVTEIEGGNGMLDSGSVLAASDLLHPEIAKVLKAATAGR